MTRTAIRRIVFHRLVVRRRWSGPDAMQRAASPARSPTYAGGLCPVWLARRCPPYRAVGAVTFTTAHRHISDWVLRLPVDNAAPQRLLPFYAFVPTTYTFGMLILLPRDGLSPPAGTSAWLISPGPPPPDDRAYLPQLVNCVVLTDGLCGC